MNAWEVVYDGDSLPMIRTPDGRYLRLQEHSGAGNKWAYGEFTGVDARELVNAINKVQNEGKK